MLYLIFIYSSEICQQRYQAAFERYNRQFLKEIQHLEQMQSCAIKAMAIHRYI